MKVELEKIMPREIEKRSFEIITQELGERTFKDQAGNDCKAVYSYECRF